MGEDIFLCTVRIYNSQNRIPDDSSRALVAALSNLDSGTPVQFHSNGKDYFGEVISSIRVQRGGEIQRLLMDVSDRDVRVHLSDRI